MAGRTEGKKANGSGGVSASQKERPRSPITGQPVPPGRPKGVPNKITRTFKAAAEKAFEKGGGVDWLVKMMNGTASDRAAVLQLFGRLIPHQIAGEVNHAVKVELSWLQGRAIGKTSDHQSVGHSLKHEENQEVIDVTPLGVTDVCDATPAETRLDANETHSY